MYCGKWLTETQQLIFSSDTFWHLDCLSALIAEHEKQWPGGKWIKKKKKKGKKKNREGEMTHFSRP